jgi:prevent-host-death family protein
MVSQMSSREFNQDTSGAKRAAERGPVYITDRGKPAYVLLAYDAYASLVGTNRVVELLAEPAGVEDIEFTTPLSDEPAEPASL